MTQTISRKKPTINTQIRLADKRKAICNRCGEPGDAAEMTPRFCDKCGPEFFRNLPPGRKGV